MTDSATSCALPSEVATAQLGAAIAEVLAPGDCVLLDGALGAGKTALVRAILRGLAADPGLDVPSPTFTLLQPYEAADGRAILHADLYRLRSPDELVELGFEELAERAIALVEWPDRLGPDPGRPVLAVDLDAGGPGRGRPATSGDEQRVVDLTEGGAGVQHARQHG